MTLGARAFTAASFLLGLALTACPPAVVQPGADGGDPNPLGNDGGPDGSAGDAGFDAGEPEPDGGPPRTGNLFLLTATTSGGSTTSLTFTNAVADAGARCFVSRQGPCLVIDCSGPAPLDLVSAGELVVVRDGGVAISALPDDAGLYPTVNRGGAQWAPGEPLTIRASGGELPRFSMSLTAPPRVVPLSLLETDGGTPLLVRSEDFPVHWVPLDAGVAVVITQLGPQGVMSARRVVCGFDGPGALGVVPAAALASLEPAKATAISVGGLSLGELAPGGYRVRVQVTNASAFRADVADSR